MMDKLKAADGNMKSPEGVAYLKQFQPKFDQLLAGCEDAAGKERYVFMLAIEVAADGGVQDAFATPPTDTSACFFEHLRAIAEHDKTPFPRPPHGEYWLKYEMQPGMAKVAAK